MKKSNQKGFTLAELLIVVAIIAVLVAIAIPVFGAQLEKSRDAVDLANARAKYAELQTALISGGSLDDVVTSLGAGWTKVSNTSITSTFDGKGQTAGWTSGLDHQIGSIEVSTAGQEPNLITFTLAADRQVTAVALSRTGS